MENEIYRNQVKIVYHLLILLFILIAIVLVGAYAYLYTDKNVKQVENIILPEKNGMNKIEIENKVHVPTGLEEGEGLTEVINNCTNCHSAKLITQNRMNREMWLGSIRWMQKTQNLWDLGKNEDIILNYLSTHYAPVEKGRREPLTNIEWYNLTE